MGYNIMLSTDNTLFGQMMSVYLNNTQLARTKYTDISNTFYFLKDILLTGEFKFPFLNNTFENLQDNVNIAYYDTYTNLIETNAFTKELVAYDKARIYDETNLMIDFFLDLLNDEYRNVVLNLNAIYEATNKNLNHFRHILYLLNNVNQDINTNTDISTFSFYTNLFPFLFKREPLSSNSDFKVDFEESKLNVVPGIILYFLLTQLYEQNSKTVNDYMDSIYSNPSDILMQPGVLDNWFVRYLNDNIDEISQNMMEYIKTNIFLFGKKSSPKVNLTVQSIISNHITNIKNIILNNTDTFNPYDHIYRISNYTYNYCVNHSLLKNCLRSDSFFNKLDEFTFYDQDDHDHFKQIDYYEIKNSIIKYFQDNVGLIKQIVNIPIKWTSNPVFFINTLPIVFAKFSLNYMQERECFSYGKLDKWLAKCINITTYDPVKKINIVDNLKVNNLIDFVLKNPILYDDDSFKFSAFFILQEYITNLINSQQFNTFLIKELIPDLNKHVSLEYKIDINWYEKVDEIMYLYKLNFTTDLLDSLNNKKTSLGKPKLFDEYCTYFRSSFPSKIIAPKLDKETISTLFQFHKSDVNKWFYLFNSFFKNSAICQYVPKYLVNTYGI